MDLDKVRGKIDAIKAIRDLNCVITEDINHNGVKIQRISVDFSLKAAKDLVERIMEIGARESANSDSQELNKLRNQITELNEACNVANNKYWELRDKLSGLLY